MFPPEFMSLGPAWTAVRRVRLCVFRRPNLYFNGRAPVGTTSAGWRRSAESRQVLQEGEWEEFLVRGGRSFLFLLLRVVVVVVVG